MKAQIPGASRILNDARFKNLADLLGKLNAGWTPHAGQVQVGEQIFVNGARRIFLECGRKWGKTEFCADICWRLGNMIQGGQIYYFGAYAKAVREFLWAPGRLQNHGPAEYVKETHKTEMRLTFTSETFVKLDGSDEFKISKGFNPDVVILDEFADYSEDFWVAMSPNFASKDTIVIIVSSPPWILESEPGKPVIFTRIADLWAKYQKEAEKQGKRSKYVYINQPTSCNPNIPQAWLEEEERALREMGLEDVWEREYLARRVIGGGKRIISNFDRTKHIFSHDWIMKNKIERNKGILQWLTVTDPSNSAFGVVHMAINPYSKEVYWLDEILEKEESETTEQALWPRIEEKENELYPDENEDQDRFLRVCDEAAKWWIVGCANDPEINIHFDPTEKHLNSKEFGLSLLRSIFRFNKGFVSDRCEWLAWQIENYRKDKRGQIPKANDDLIDASRYGLHKVSYYLSADDVPTTPAQHPREVQKQARRGPDEDVRELVEDLERHGPFAVENMTEDGPWQH